MLRSRSVSVILSLALIALATGARPLFADGGAPDGANSAWILSSTALVLFMTLPGLALFYGGMVRSKNVLTILMQCFSIACMVSILWYAVGFSIALGKGNAWFGGFQRAFLAGISESSLNGSLPESVFVMFQMTFAIITPALIIGSFAERMRFSAVMFFSARWLLLVIGTTAGLVCFFATLTLKRTLKIDDSLDVFPVHGVGGMLGTLAVGVFASSELGVFSGQGLAEGVSIAHQVLVQLGGIVTVGLYTALLTWGLLRLTALLVRLRVSVEEDTEGLDIVLHNERGYDL